MTIDSWTKWFYEWVINIRIWFHFIYKGKVILSIVCVCFLLNRVNQYEGNKNSLCLFVLLVVIWTLSFYYSCNFNCLSCYYLTNVVVSQFTHDLTWCTTLRVNFLNFDPLNENTFYLLFFKNEDFATALFLADFTLVGLWKVTIS